MPTPAETLGLDPTADEAAIRKRYLELVRQFPPDRDPERFAEIRNAYDQLRDPLTTLETQIFKPQQCEGLAEILMDLAKESRDERYKTDALLRLASTP